MTELVLRKVLEWCHNHESHCLATTSHYNGWDDGLFDTKPTATKLVEWDQKLMQVDQTMIFEIIVVSICLQYYLHFSNEAKDFQFQAANYLDIEPLHNIGCKTIANMLKGKSPEEIRKTFNLSNDFTPEEAEQIRRENEENEFIIKMPRWLTIWKSALMVNPDKILLAGGISLNISVVPVDDTQFVVSLTLYNKSNN